MSIRFLRFVVVLVVGASSLALGGCGEKAPENTRVFTQDDAAKLKGLPQSEVIGATVDSMVGEVSQVEAGDYGNSLVVYTDPENREGQVIVDTPTADANEGDIVRFSGEVTEFFEGENMMGAKIEIPRVVATDFEVTDARALDPAQESIKVKATKDLAGVQITVQRAEIAEGQTRIWVRYKNNSSEDFVANPTLTANGEQVETDYSDDYKAPANSVSPGAKSSGVLVFEPVEPGSRLALRFDGYDANFNEIKVVFRFGG